MKTFIYVLVLANVLLFIWLWLQPEPRSIYADQTLPPLSVTSLQLHSETDVSETVLNATEGSPEEKQFNTEETSAAEAVKDIPVDVDLSVESVPTVKKYCYQLGEFKAEQEIKVLMSKLVKELNTTATLLDTQKLTTEKVNYWVVIPPYASKSEAEKAIKRLKSAKVKDFFLVRSGEMENAISLGVFSTKKAAETRFTEIKKLKLRIKEPVVQDKIAVKERLVAIISVEISGEKSVGEALEKVSERQVVEQNCE